MDSAPTLLNVREGVVPTAPVFLLDSNEDAQRAVRILKDAWYAAHYAPAATPYHAKVEAERLMLSARRRVEHEAILRFGRVNPKYPNCEQCLWVSVFGGPRHEAGSLCESGKRNHCTCPNCWG